LDGLLEVGETFLFRFALAVRAGNFQTSRPKTPFTGFAPVNNGCELSHGDILALFVAEEKEFISPVALAQGCIKLATLGDPVPERRL
jgi:hypothetical protein